MFYIYRDNRILLHLITAIIALSVISYNCEGINDQRIELFQDIIRQYRPSFLCLQKTWLLDTNSSLLNLVSNEYNAFSISGAHERDKILYGSSPGGVAVLVDTTIVKNIKPITQASKRVCAVECNYNNMHIIVVSFYMPCDTQYNYICEEYLDVLNELKLLLYKDDYDEILLTGDWNTDFNRNNMQSKELLNFVNRSKLFVIPQNGTFTFQTRNMLSRSMIDHMFVLEGGSLSRHCEPTEHIDSGINLSSQVPLLGKFNIENIYSRKCKSREKVKGNACPV